MSLRACIFALAAVAGVSTAAPTAATNSDLELSRRQTVPTNDVPTLSYTGPSGSISTIPATSADDRTFILGEHNVARTYAKGAVPLAYDSALECVARKWLEESRNAGRTGDNYKGSGGIYLSSAWYQNAFQFCKSQGPTAITDDRYSATTGWFTENYSSGQIRESVAYPSAVDAWTIVHIPGKNLGTDGLPCSEQEAYFGSYGDAAIGPLRCLGRTYRHYENVMNTRFSLVGCASDPLAAGTLCMYF